MSYSRCALHRLTFDRRCPVCGVFFGGGLGGRGCTQQLPLQEVPRKENLRKSRVYCEASPVVLCRCSASVPLFSSSVLPSVSPVCTRLFRLIVCVRNLPVGLSAAAMLDAHWSGILPVTDAAVSCSRSSSGLRIIFLCNGPHHSDAGGAPPPSCPPPPLPPPSPLPPFSPPSPPLPPPPRCSSLLRGGDTLTFNESDMQRDVAWLVRGRLVRLSISEWT